MQRRYIWVFLILLIALLIALFEQAMERPRQAPPVAPGGYQFAFWNVENLFDDVDDDRTAPGDREYDEWLSKNPDLLKRKLAKLAEAILQLNDGKGPDLLGIVEVESERAADLLRLALNAKLPAELHYEKPVMKEVRAGRHIAPALITRLPVVRDRTRLLDKRLRILEAHVVANDQPLTVIVSHWSSRIRESGEQGREKYANKIYGRAQAIWREDPLADILICGDFNDTPDDASVSENLRATGDPQKVKAAGSRLALFNLFAGKDPAEYGTLYHSGWFIFDQIVVSPGMLDNRGWSCDVDSVRSVKSLVRPADKLRRPWRFGSPKEKSPRGYSDHFPVTVQLRVHDREVAAVRQSTMRKE